MEEGMDTSLLVSKVKNLAAMQLDTDQILSFAFRKSLARCSET